MTDIPLLIRKYCIIKKQESNWPLSRLYSCISVVFCNMRDTDLWHNIMHNLPSSCHLVNLCLIFMYTRDVKLSFPNNSIKKFTLWIFTLYVTILISFLENDPYIYIHTHTHTHTLLKYASQFRHIWKIQLWKHMHTPIHLSLAYTPT